MEKETLKNTVPSVTKTAKKADWRIRGAIYSALFSLLVFGFLRGLMGINAFFSDNELKFNRVIEIKLNPPIEVKKREPKIVEKLVKAEPTPQAGMELVKPILATDNAPIQKYVDFIYWRESHRDDPKMAGLHKTCLAQGKWNGVGYLPEPSFCFPNKEIGMATLKKELTERLAVNNEVEVLCVYNLGFQKDENGKRIPYLNCKYYQDYLSFVK